MAIKLSFTVEAYELAVTQPAGAKIARPTVFWASLTGIPGVLEVRKTAEGYRVRGDARFEPYHYMRHIQDAFRRCEAGNNFDTITV